MATPGANLESYRFTIDSLLEFLRDLEPLDLKYCKPLWAQNNLSVNEKQLYVAQYEQEYLRLPQRVMRVDSIYKDLKLIYGHQEPIAKYAETYQLVINKIIQAYLGIPGLEKMFSAQYFRHEWQMHLKIEYGNNSYSHYRDHFIHQIKDAFEACIFMQKFGFMDATITVIDNDGTAIASYVKAQARKAYHNLLSNPELRLLYKRLFGQADKEDTAAEEAIEDAAAKATKKDTSAAEIDPDEKDKIIRTFTERILLSSELIAGLYHDIGYPIEYAMENNEELTEYLPVIEYFVDSRDNETHLQNLLCNSLLFTVVPTGEIVQGYRKKDHGVLSALAFLVYFYESGSIYSLDAIQRAAIELGALNIYNHTLHYRITGEDTAHYGGPVFTRNPMSYLFRLCDDIQEWDRLYLLLSYNRNLRVCRTCLTPILPHLISKTDSTGIPGASTETNDPLQMTVDICACNQEADVSAAGCNLKELWEHEHGAETLSPIEYRKLNHVKVCDYVQVDVTYLDNGKQNVADDNTLQLLEIQLHYSPYRLLQLAKAEPEFSIFRAQDLNKLRKMLKNQDIMPEVLVTSFISTNPIHAKVRILREFIQACSMLGLPSWEQLESVGVTHCAPKRGVFFQSNDGYYFDVSISNAQKLKEACSAFDKLASLPSDTGKPTGEYNGAWLHQCFFGPLIGAAGDLTTILDLFNLSEIYQNLTALTNVCYTGQAISCDRCGIANRVNSRLSVYLILLFIAKRFEATEDFLIKKQQSNNTIERIEKELLGLLLKDLQQISLIKDYRKNNHGSTSLEHLLYDYLVQMRNERSYTEFWNNGRALPQRYWSQYEWKDYQDMPALWHDVAEYADQNTYHPFEGKDDLDYYFDLYFFQALSETTAEIEWIAQRIKNKAP